MTAMSQVKAAVVTALNGADIETIAAYSEDKLKAYTTAVAAVGQRELKFTKTGQLDYLGQRYDSVLGKTLETYGRRMELTMSIDIYAPRALGAAGCETAAETVSETMLTALPSGLKLRSLSWQESEWDKTYGMFHLAGEAEYSALFAAEADEDGTEFTDFILRGVVQSNDQYST